MRIGIDMLAVQSPHHGHRGIGRYSGHLVSALLERNDQHEYVLYAHENLPTDLIPSHLKTSTRWIRTEPELGVSTVSQAVDNLIRHNPDALDAFLVLSPFEHWCNYTPPAKPAGSSIRMAAVVYDMIPFLFQNESASSATLTRFYRVLEDLRRYDILLAISESTQRDTQSLLGLPEGQIVNISAATDHLFFKPDERYPVSNTSRKTLEDLDIHKPFILNVGGMDERKNSFGLIDIFSRLPEELRATHQLVLAFGLAEEEVEWLHQEARDRGIEDALVVTRKVSDEALLTLYQQCKAFVFPSVYEGFGLPILEALSCGAVVVAGNNSSQIEVVGEAGLLANVSDPNDVAEKLARVLTDSQLRRKLQENALPQADKFRWDHTGKLAMDALVGQPPETSPRLRRLRAHRSHHSKPRIAFFSPLPPRKSGVSDYSQLLLGDLSKTYRIDLYHDAGYVPETALASDEFRARDYRLFARFAPQEDYHAVVYQMGNSRYHSYMYETMLNVPGVVTLHDFCLAGFHLHYGQPRGGAKEYLRDQLLRWYPEDAEKIELTSKGWTTDLEVAVRNCAESGWYLNRRLIDASTSVIVHSPWCVEQVRKGSPEYLDKMAMIPHGIQPKDRSPERRRAIRERFNIPQDALVFASFGFIHPEKLSPEALDAFKVVADENDKAIFLFVGEDADGGIVRRHAASLGLQECSRFLGRTSIEDFADLATVTDVGVNLRKPPTNGETSGALLYLLSAGIATIVTDVATFSDYPNDVVRRVKWDENGPRELTRVCLELARNSKTRVMLGDSAWDYVATHHEWSRVAKQYVEVIERSHTLHKTTREQARRKPLSLAPLRDSLRSTI